MIDNLIKFNVQFEFDTQSSSFKCGRRHYFAESDNIPAEAAVLADELLLHPKKEAATKCGGLIICIEKP